MIVAYKTDSPEAEVILLDTDGKIVDAYTWTAHRSLARDLLKVTKERLALQAANWKSISGFIVFAGPGSFTGLRISAAVANTIAHSEGIAIVGTTGEGWLRTGLKRLAGGENDKIVLPIYGSEAHTTKPKK